MYPDYVLFMKLTVTHTGTVQAAIIGIPVAAVVSDQPRIAIPVIQVVIFFICMATQLLIFVPKILSLRERRKNKNKKQGTFTRQYLERVKADVSDGGDKPSGLALKKFETTSITPEVPPKKGGRSNKGGEKDIICCQK